MKFQLLGDAFGGGRVPGLVTASLRDAKLMPEVLQVDLKASSVIYDDLLR